MNYTCRIKILQNTLLALRQSSETMCNHVELHKKSKVKVIKILTMLVKIIQNLETQKKSPQSFHD